MTDKYDPNEEAIRSFFQTLVGSKEPIPSSSGRTPLWQLIGGIPAEKQTPPLPVPSLSSPALEPTAGQPSVYPPVSPLPFCLSTFPPPPAIPLSQLARIGSSIFPPPPAPRIG